MILMDSVGRVGFVLYVFVSVCVQDLGWTPDDWKYRFNPDHVKDIAGATQNASRQRSHLMQLRSASVNEIQIGMQLGHSVLFNTSETMTVCHGSTAKYLYIV